MVLIALNAQAECIPYLSVLLFAAPGFQLALEGMIVEASVQLPVIRGLKNALEPDYVFVIGTRITW